MSRPEYIRCIEHTHGEKVATSWCGKLLTSFDKAFIDIEHAAYTSIEGGRLLPCPECVKAVAEALAGERGKG